MGKRIKVALNYHYDENWIGGTYYIQNLIHALQTLDDAKKPVLHIKSNNENSVSDLKKLTSYPYFETYNPYNKINTVKRVFNKISRTITQSNIFPLYQKFDAVFPAAYQEKENLENKIFWIPDFQEKYLPHFFSEKEIAERDLCYKKIQQNAHSVIFSSKDAQKDFNKFYLDAKPKQFVLNFATFHQNHNLPLKEEVFKKYNIIGDYFLCSNQFWVHKNHIVILQAISLLKKEGISITVVFTGKENDYRNPDYFSDLKEHTRILEIEENVKFLGFIDRNEQIVLLKNCKSIIQPSLFEGWSTVNEDAKSENAFIISADLEVNLEQLKNYPNYRIFEAKNAQSLADEIKKDNFEIQEIDYTKDIKKFGERFLEIVQNINK